MDEAWETERERDAGGSCWSKFRRDSIEISQSDGAEGSGNILSNASVLLLVIIIAPPSVRHLLVVLLMLNQQSSCANWAKMKRLSLFPCGVNIIL